MKKNTYFQEREAAELLQTFSRQECKDFTAFLKGRGSSNVQNMWAQLRKKHPDYQIKEEAIFKRIRPKEDFHDKTYRQWVSELYGHAKAFVAICEFEANDAHYTNTLAMALLKRGAKRIFQKTLKEQSKATAKKTRFNSDFYFYRYQLEDTRYQFITVYDHRSTTNSLQLASDYHDECFLVHKLKYLFVMHNRQRIIREQYQYHLEDDLLRSLDQNPRKDIPLLHLYFLLVKLMADLHNRTLFLEFVQFFKQHQASIDQVESRQLLTSGSNICYWNIELGYLDYLQDRFDLAKIMVENGHVMVEGYFPAYHFRNIMRVAIEAGELDWAGKFLLENLPKTHPQHQENLGIFNRAYLHFARGEYEEQKPFMQELGANDFQFIDIYNEIAFRLLNIKTAYEQLSDKLKPLEVKAFQANLESFRIYLSRKDSIPESMVLSHQNFRKALKLLFMAKHGKRSVDKDLRTRVLDLLPMIELPWLMGKV